MKPEPASPEPAADSRTARRNRAVPSLLDVAARAGVSLATASRVVSLSAHPVADTTRQRVLDAARALDFEPNLVARGLVAQRTRTLGVIVHDMTDEYFAQIARGIEDVAYEHGYMTLVCNSDRDTDKEVAYVRKLRSMRVDAIVFTASGIVDAAHQRALRSQVRQVAVVVRLAAHPGGQPDVNWSPLQGYRLAVDHLKSLGHRDIGFVRGPDNLSSANDRYSAAAEAISDAGLTLRPAAVLAGDYTREGGEAAAIKLVASARRPTAVLTANDQLAIGLLRGLRQKGLRVPRDVSIIGFDDIRSCAYVEPALTTVHVPLYELGCAGALLAIERLDGRRRHRRPTLQLELIRRSSTGQRPAQ